MHEEELKLRDDIKELIRAKKFDELDNLWLTVVEGDKLGILVHEAIARYLLNRKEIGRLGEMYNLLLSARNESGHHEHALAICRALLDLEPNLLFVRPHVIDAMRGIYSDRSPERLDQYFEISGLSDETSTDLRKAIGEFEDLVGASKGQVFQHSQWGLGIVSELDPVAGWAKLDFPAKKNHQMTLEGIKNYLRRIPHDHVLARMAKEPEQFKAEMMDDPAAAVRQALKNYGGKLKSSELKRIFDVGKKPDEKAVKGRTAVGASTLAGKHFMTDAEYRKFWAKAKDAVRLDPFIDMDGKGASAMLILRKEPRSFVDEIRVKLIEASTAEERRAVLRDVDRHGSDADLTPEDTDALTMLFMKPVEDGSLKTDEQKFAHGVLYEEFRHLFREDTKNPIEIDEYLKRPAGEVGEMVASLKVFELKRIALDHVLENREADAPDIFERAFFDADSRLVAWMEKKLASSGSHDVIEHCLERILAQPERNPEIFVWAARKAIDGQFPHVTESITPLAICESALRALNDFDAEARSASEKEEKILTVKGGRLRSLLQDQQSRLVKKAVRGVNADDARRFLASVNMAPGLTNQLRVSLEQLVYAEVPSLRRVSKSEEAEEKQKPAFHYTTAEALEAKRRQLSQIVTVEIPASSEAIGIAREHGDLKENAEYHAAKDRQKLLMQQAQELEELIARARVVNLDSVSINEVRFGTRVTLENVTSGEEERLTVMGMWEANSDKQIISYLTPLGSQLMKRKPDEEFTVTLPDGRLVEYRVKSIEKAAAPVG